MARQPQIATPLYVVDTSYLTELFGVPGFSNEQGMREVRRRFKDATKGGCLIFVPIPCLLELANHVSDVRDGSRRQELANQLLSSVAHSIKNAKPWIVNPFAQLEDFLKQFSAALDAFAHQHVRRHGFGLTDSFSAQEANRLKAKYRSLNYRVHIWTKHNHLKQLEPDPEENPYIG
jgi:hypothetical protein